MCNGIIDYCAFGAVINNMLFSACLCDLCGKSLVGWAPPTNYDRINNGEYIVMVGNAHPTWLQNAFLYVPLRPLR